MEFYIEANNQLILLGLLITFGIICFIYGYKEMKHIIHEDIEIEEPNKYDSIDPSSEIEEQWKTVDKIETLRIFIIAIGLIICGIYGIIHVIKSKSMF